MGVWVVGWVVGWQLGVRRCDGMKGIAGVRVVEGGMRLEDAWGLRGMRVFANYSAGMGEY